MLFIGTVAYCKLQNLQENIWVSKISENDTVWIERQFNEGKSKKVGQMKEFELIRGRVSRLNLILNFKSA